MYHQQACTINRHGPSTGMDHAQVFTCTGIHVLIRRLKKSTYPETASTINQHPPSTGMYHQQACTINRHGPSTGFYPHRHTEPRGVKPPLGVKPPPGVTAASGAVGQPAGQRGSQPAAVSQPAGQPAGLYAKSIGNNQKNQKNQSLLPKTSKKRWK